MLKYEVIVRVDPPKLFGLAEEGTAVLPPGTTPNIRWTPDLSRVWAEAPGIDDPLRKYNERFLVSVEIDDIRVSGDDNLFHVWLDASSTDAAADQAEVLIRRLFLARSTLLEAEGAHTYQVTTIEIRLPGANFTKVPEGVTQLYLYDLRALEEEIRQAAFNLQGLSSNDRLGQALDYFALGDDLAHMRNGRQRDAYFNSVAPLRFLQYWKALATIIGDPSKDRDHQSRPQRIGLPRTFFRHVVRPLNDLRNKFDVAHVSDPEARQIVMSEHVKECREAAKHAIVAYMTSKAKQT